MNIQRIWARGFPLFLSILFLTILSACNLGATDEQQLNVTDLPQQTQNALQASPSPNQPTRTPSGVVVLPTPQAFPTAQLFPTLSFRPPPQPIISTLTAQPVNVFILSPIPGNVVASNVQVIGAAMHPEFLQYQLEYGPDPNPSNLWYPITGGVQSPVFNGLLGIWNTNTSNTPDGLYQIRLRVFLRNGVNWGNVVVNNIRIQNRIPTPVPTNTQVAGPIAAFTQDRVTGTAPLTVSFINLSSPTNVITGFTWNFGDGTTSTEISPIKTFNNPGQYTVTLTATGPGGSSNVSRQITVQSANPPVAGFTTDKTTGTAPLTVQFTNASTGGQITNYLWNFSDGTTSVDQNPSHQFTNVGTYNVILTVTGPGGSSNVSRQITVGNPIQASISAVPDTNNPLRINLTATATGGSGTYTAYDWDFGNGQTLFGQPTATTSVTYASASTYTVTLTVTDSTGAKKSVTQPITIQAPPPPLTGDFAVTQANNTDLTVGFVASATGGSGSYSYTWDFGDNVTGSGASGSHTYAGAGTYTVELSINDGINTITVTKDVTISDLPPITADFTINQTSPTDLNVGFAATASGGTGAYTYSWNFGDNTSGSDQNMNHAYAGAGTYTVTLTVGDGVNSVDVVKNVVIEAVQPDLSADFTINQTSPTDLNVGFSATASGGTGAYTYSWNFGDNTSGSDQNMNHAYTGAGTYTVTLTVGDGVTTVDVVKNVVIEAVQPSLSADFTVTQTSPTDLNVGFSATATGGTGNYTYSWNFGDNTSGSDQNMNHAYADAGTYTVTLTVGDGVNTVDVVKNVVIEAVQPDLSADFTINQTSPTDLNVGFSGSATGGTGTYTYSWNFGDNTSGSDQNMNHAYAGAGTYTVTLTVGDGVNTVDVVKNVVIEAVQLPTLTADFTVTQTSPTDLNVGFSGSATGGTGAYTYSWNFGDNTSGSDQFTNHAYAGAGTYTVTLTVGDGVNSVDVVKNVVIEAVQLPTLTADFTVTQTSPTDLNVGFSGSATGGTGTYTYSWNFGDNTSGSDQNMNHAYAGAGTYTVTLTVGDGVNSVDVVKNVVIEAVQLPTLTADFTITQTSPTDLNVGFSGSATGGTGTYTYSWNFGDNTSGTDQFTNHAYAGAGTYTVTLTVGDGVTTVDVVKNVVIETVQLPTLTADFTVTQTSPTDLNVGFSGSATGGTGTYTYSWNFGDNTSGTDQFTNHAYAGAGTYTVTLTVGDGVTTVDVVKNVIIETVQAPPYAGTVPVLDNIGELTPDLNPVYNNGQTSGLSSSAFALVGDQTALDPNFLRAAFNIDPNTSNALQLQATIDRFNTTGSFTRSSVAVGTLTAQDLLNSGTNPSCNGGESLFQCEIRLANGSIVIVSVGYQDALNGLDSGAFQTQINQVIQQALANNVIPVLMTIQPSTNSTANTLINAYNEIIITSTESARVPVINTWRALNDLPNQGLGGGDTPSVDGNGAGYLTDVPTAGANARNYYTLVTLNDIVNTLFTP